MMRLLNKTQSNDWFFLKSPTINHQEPLKIIAGVLHVDKEWISFGTVDKSMENNRAVYHELTFTNAPFDHILLQDDKGGMKMAAAQ